MGLQQHLDPTDFLRLFKCLHLCYKEENHTGLGQCNFKRSWLEYSINLLCPVVHFKDPKLFNLESTLTHDTNIFQQPDFPLNYYLQQPFWLNYIEYRPVAYFKIIKFAVDRKRDCHIFRCDKTCS